MSLTTRVFRALAILSVLALTYVMIRQFYRPDWPQTQIQVIFFIVVTGLGWIGGIGVLFNRFYVIAIGATGLLLLGIWQAVLWIIILPTAILLIIAGIAAYPIETSSEESDL